MNVDYFAVKGRLLLPNVNRDKLRIAPGGVPGRGREPTKRCTPWGASQRYLGGVKRLFALLGILAALAGLAPLETRAWGFFAHQRINRLAVYTLPPELFGFYKRHIVYVTEHATDPDSRRTVVVEEAPRHYIDLDCKAYVHAVHSDSTAWKLPRYWKDAVALVSEDTLNAYGIVPWHAYFVKYQLTEAFKQRDLPRILKLSADLGHYLADACVPLHTSENYNGQFTNQRGIHGLWESRLPELLAGNYDFFVGPAPYLPKPQLTIWDAVISSHRAVDSVFVFERDASAKLGDDRKYGFEERNNATIRTYSRPYVDEYHKMLNGQVERQMRRAIKLVGAMWYTAWVDAGQPALDNMPGELTPAQQQEIAAEQQLLRQGGAVKPRQEHE